MTEIRVHHADDVARRGVEALDHRGPEPELAAAMNHRQRKSRRQLVGERAGTVRRVVVDDDELAVDAVLTPHAGGRFHQLPQPIALVVGGDDDRTRPGRPRSHVGGDRQRARRRSSSSVSSGAPGTSTGSNASSAAPASGRTRRTSDHRVVTK